MECRFCRAWNQEDERRCVRCGRRLHAAAPRPAPDTYPVMTATAPAFEALPGGRPMSAAPNPASAAQSGARPPDPSPAQLGHQGSLFPGPKVVPLPTLAPVRPPGGARRGSTRPPGPRTPRRTDSQQSLDFSDVNQPLDMQVEAVIYCDAPVAVPTHRLIAAAVDASMILIAVGLFMGVFLLSGGRLVFTKQLAPLFLGMVGALWVMYHMLWCLADGDTPGMRFAGLRLVNFDGRIPDRDQRGVRQAAYVLSVLSAGVGLLWALVDEENLTWHDHISKTFPTPG
ncbi:MAG TPA: RDD family protein [Bryobacteraceae bacterium]|nr:RDD family protein [Bryobacteraceae bacterium]